MGPKPSGTADLRPRGLLKNPRRTQFARALRTFLSGPEN